MTEIKILNDNLRKYLIGGEIILTQNIEVKTYEEIAEIMLKIHHFDNFTHDSDPYGEHDFESFDYNDEKIYWKIDYYDQSMQYLSLNLTDIAETVCVVIVMLASEH